MSEAGQINYLAYQKGYRAGSCKKWPAHKPPLPPDDIAREIIRAASALRDGCDSAIAAFDEDDEIVKQLAPLIDGFDNALTRLGLWLHDSSPAPERKELRAVTVAELIAELQKMPQDAPVMYMCCSDYSPLEPGDVKLVPAESGLVVYRGGRYCDAGPYQNCWGNEKPVFVQAVIFPGN